MDSNKSCLSKWHVFFVVWALIIPNSIGAQSTVNTPDPVNTDNVATFFDFVAQEASKIIFKLSIDSILNSRNNDSTFAGSMVVIKPGGDSVFFKTNFSTRGKFRRKNCDFPPLKLDLSKNQLASFGLSEYDEYKLVTHCLDDHSQRDLVLKEFLLYQLFHNLTNHSFKATLFPVTYSDTSSQIHTTSYAFIIESNKELADRLGGNYCDCPDLEIGDLDAFHFELMCLFHYMVGNRDMHVGRKHNLKLLRSQKTEKLISIPYDFDFSAFVGAPYIYPTYENKLLVDRFYLGSSENQEVMNSVYQVFLERKDSLLNTIEEFDLLPKFERRLLIKYLKRFYRDLERGSYQLEYQY